jgi:hypothetical protein
VIIAQDINEAIAVLPDYYRTAVRHVLSYSETQMFPELVVELENLRDSSMRFADMCKKVIGNSI